MNIKSTTKIICLLGHPVKHSFSPVIHNYLFEKYNENKIYTCFDVESDKLKNSVNGIKALKIEGCNVTIPHKVDIIKYIDSIDSNAKLIGAVNTIKNEGSVLKGYNTDGMGFVKSILDKEYDLCGKKIMIIGAGGACRSIAIELCLNDVKSIEIRNRSINSAMEISDVIKSNFNTYISYSNESIIERDLNNIDILINTTPIGMESKLCPIDENLTPKNNLLVCDIVYKPHETAFIKWAKKHNLDVVYGIDMLINQAIEAFYIWTGIKANHEDIKHIKMLYEESIKTK
ncbi:shikimate dehydrogenase [Clostridium sp. CCUG 7971]|uniref:shikimate dehydrogenase n=1 Tax=Clostridium sp. CCUG 7971 TaxID=2811414 RepID=UPI001ABA38AF|nr:shikimate dehydrogenase [Clostridium sp. CCUG 7971]MBO3443757.1 shikimate dehydrogenase [Clostridium sp. CCUG 7971]